MDQFVETINNLVKYCINPISASFIKNDCFLLYVPPHSRQFSFVSDQYDKLISFRDATLLPLARGADV